MTDREAIRAGIVLKTIEEIERVGLSHLTVRGLADAAGVNVAAVSYYFGGKAALIDAALSQTLNHLLADLEDMSGQLETEPLQATERMLSYLLEGALRYPNVTRAHVHDVFTGLSSPSSGQQGLLSTGMAPTINKVSAAIARTTGLTDMQALMRAVQAFSAVLFPSFVQFFFHPSGALDSTDSRSNYVHEVVRTAFSDSTSR